MSGRKMENLEAKSQGRIENAAQSTQSSSQGSSGSRNNGKSSSSSSVTGSSAGIRPKKEPNTVSSHSQVKTFSSISEYKLVNDTEKLLLMFPEEVRQFFRMRNE